MNIRRAAQNTRDPGAYGVQRAETPLQGKMSMWETLVSTINILQTCEGDQVIPHIHCIVREGKLHQVTKSGVACGLQMVQPCLPGHKADCVHCSTVLDWKLTNKQISSWKALLSQLVTTWVERLFWPGSEKPGIGQGICWRCGRKKQKPSCREEKYFFSTFKIFLPVTLRTNLSGSGVNDNTHSKEFSL